MHTLRRRIAVLLAMFALAGLAAGLVAARQFDDLATLGVAALATAATAWVVGAVFARSLTASLSRLAAAASSFASGNRDVRADLGGPREVRLIAQSFNRMASGVNETLELLGNEESRKTQFVSDVSHELRTPLTAIRGAAETLLDGGVSPDDQERFLSTIATEAERLTRLANDLLQLQRIEGATGELPFRRIDLREAVVRAATMLEPLIEDRGVELTITGKAPHVLGDLDRLLQVVANLVDNATRMVGEGGHVRVDLSGEEGMSVVSVVDDGPGIPEEDISRLFDRFYRADISRTRARGGSGLGLAIVRAIVTSHGGTIEAVNLPEGGARLTVRLPALPE